MSRLADYFVVVGYDPDSKRGGGGQGKILQRLPEKDWDDCPFTSGLDLFCQPSGYKLSPQPQPPQFYVAVLTDVDADQRYCAVFTFHEPLTLPPSKPDDLDADLEGDEGEGGVIHSSLMYAPKSLVLVSRHDCFDVFRRCLGLVYTVHVENMNVSLETLVGNMLGGVLVPPAGGSQVQFSLGSGDRQTIQPPMSCTVPVSHDSVAMFFARLGINNAIKVVCAALTDHKILFMSNSLSHLTAACRALVALHYPLKYRYVYIPVLPKSLLEVLHAPTPFIASIHSSLREELADLLDVILVDLDGGDIMIPECVTVPLFSDTVLSRTKHCLNQILCSDLLSADQAFPTSGRKESSPFQRDKELRAVFLRAFVEMLSGYRSSLALIRIHPQPFITFHKAHFLGQRGLMDDDFVLRLLDSMAFNAFVTERGPPYRACDIFDEVYASFEEQLREEETDPSKITQHIQAIAHQFTLNECPNQQQVTVKVPTPSDNKHLTHQSVFPALRVHSVQHIIDEAATKLSAKNSRSNLRISQMRRVPMGTGVAMTTRGSRVVVNSVRQLDVLRNCVTFIFDNKISDARIIFPAVLRALKSSVARLVLTEELSYHVQSNRAVLERQQFDLVVRLLNAALQNDTSIDEYGVAYRILPLAAAFCRKLCTGVMQFAYTCVQEHEVWGSQAFWEQSFYQDVHQEVRQLYLPHYEEHQMMADKQGSTSPLSPDFTQFGDRFFSWRKECSQASNGRSSSTAKTPKQMGALEIAAEQLRVQSSMTLDQREEAEKNEESTVFSQAIHYAHRMVYMRLPLDASRSSRPRCYTDPEDSSVVTPSNAGSDSYDAESGFDETEPSDVSVFVTKFITRFIDKVCTEGGVSADHLKSLYQMIPGMISMHLETLESVHRESKRLPPVQKPKILTPALLPGEVLEMDGLRVYLLADGREEGLSSTLESNLGSAVVGPALIPAEGGLFLSNYRIIFKGTPCDSLVCEQCVVRSFPVSTLTKEKKMNVQSIPHLDQALHEGLQLRSATFQVIKVAFDEEVSSDDVEMLRKRLHRLHSPPSLLSTFPFTSTTPAHAAHLHKGKDKHATLRHIAKRTLQRTAQKAGLKLSQQKHKFITPSLNLKLKHPSLSHSSSDSHRVSSASILSVVDEHDSPTSLSLTDSKNMDRLVEQPFYRDLERLELGNLLCLGQRSRQQPFRLTTVNTDYSVCRSYPALLAIPQSVNDESVRKFARSHRHSRLPVITWRHPSTKALLLRGSGFHSRTSMGVRRQNIPGSSSGESSTSLEQEKYFKLLVAATPVSRRSLARTPNHDPGHDPPCPPNLLSLLRPADMHMLPDLAHQLTHGVWGSTARRGSSSAGTHLEVNGVRRYGEGSREGEDHSVAMTWDQGGELINSSVQELQRKALYVLGEKSQMKNFKANSFPKCDFIPVEFFEVREVKTSFKKLMAACCPSKPPSNKQHGFLHAIQQSGWLVQIQTVLQLAGVVVDLMDVQEASVMVCLEEGWDITAQVVSIAELLQDPYYRTLSGFRTLVEKEWLGFGHPFSRRSNQTFSGHSTEFAPVFLQFLDCVHQIHHQFPVAFEFNDYYLQFLAFHYVSNRFDSFMLSSEKERREAGWLQEDDWTINPLADKTPEQGQGHCVDQSPSHAAWNSSVWDFLDQCHKQSSIFANFMYSPESLEPVLRPYSNISNLVVWDYYVSEDLAHGPTFDLGVLSGDPEHRDPLLPSDPEGQRVVINGCYDSVTLRQPDFFKHNLQELENLESALGRLPPSNWKELWDSLAEDSQDEDYTLRRPQSVKRKPAPCHGQSSHKRTTLAILVQGKMLGETSRVVSQPHRFEKLALSTAPTSCDVCHQLLWGLSKSGVHCVDCGYNCHEKCQSQARNACTKVKVMTDTGAATSPVSVVSVGGTDVADVSDTAAVVAPDIVDFSAKSSSSEHRTHEGYLSKQGALFKGWKQRWFVLDSMKHQMRYYDTREDTHSKGAIDLAEVKTVQVMKNMPGAPKKAEENSFIEIVTARRSYHFMAPEARSAYLWVDQLQSCLQS